MKKGLRIVFMFWFILTFISASTKLDVHAQDKIMELRRWSEQVLEKNMVVSKSVSQNKSGNNTEIIKQTITKDDTTPKTDTTNEKVVEDYNQDITLHVENLPEGKYEEGITLTFNIWGNACSILSATPHIDLEFPFETKGDAYKTTSSDGTGNLQCNYYFVVRKDVKTGYHDVPFYVKYKKDGKIFEKEVILNVYTTGKPEKKEDTEPKYTSTPRVMITNFSFSKDKVYPGDEFDVNVTLKNTSSESIKNIKLSASSENNVFYSVGETGNVYIDKIGGNEEYESTFHFKASTELLAQAYDVIVNADYENQKSESFSAAEKIPLAISLKQSMLVSNLYLDESEIKIGDDLEISAEVNNTGALKLYNVRARTKGPNISERDTYVGTIAPGETGKIDFLVRGENISEAGNNQNSIVVIYEDEYGTVYEVEKPLKVAVGPAEYDNIQLVKNTEESHVGKYIKYVAIVLVIAGIVTLNIIKSKKRKAWMDEF